MSKFVYCENCGRKLTISRKALPQYARIIDLVEYHECYDEPVDIDLTPTTIPVVGEKKEKFVKKLNDLRPSAIKMDLRDRRPVEQVKQASTAPSSVLDQIQSMQNSNPAHPLIDHDSEPEPED
jgi:hypothetical protein